VVAAGFTWASDKVFSQVGFAALKDMSDLSLV
jgi:hypothetical protein